MRSIEPVAITPRSSDDRFKIKAEELPLKVTGSLR